MSIQSRSTQVEDDLDWAHKASNERLREITKSESISNFWHVQYLKYRARVVRMEMPDSLQKHSLTVRYSSINWHQIKHGENRGTTWIREITDAENDYKKTDFLKLLSVVWSFSLNHATSPQIEQIDEWEEMMTTITSLKFTVWQSIQALLRTNIHSCILILLHLIFLIRLTNMNICLLET